MNDKAKGFSLVELIVVVALIGIITAIATPSFMDWRRNVEYRAAARDIVSMMREAKARAISTNREHRVEFVVANRQYRMTQGNRAAGSSNFNTIIRDWVSLPEGVNMNIAFTGGASNVGFNPHGGSGAGNVTILDSGASTRYTITITATTGRVRVTR